MATFNSDYEPIRVVRSCPAETSSLPSGKKQTLRTRSVCPVRAVISLRSRTSHKQSAWSAPPLASIVAVQRVGNLGTDLRSNSRWQDARLHPRIQRLAFDKVGGDVDGRTAVARIMDADNPGMLQLGRRLSFHQKAIRFLRRQPIATRNLDRNDSIESCVSRDSQNLTLPCAK